MNKQFFYTRRDPITPTEEGGELKFKESKDSFNLDTIIRTFELEDGRRIVFLNDIHERIHEVPVRNKKGDVTSYVNKKYTHQSEVHLEKADSERFVKLFE